jgi:hypothetical protein
VQSRRTTQQTLEYVRRGRELIEATRKLIWELQIERTDPQRAMRGQSTAAEPPPGKGITLTFSHYFDVFQGRPSLRRISRAVAL